MVSPVSFLSWEMLQVPLYEYTCTDCHTTSEILIRGAEEPICPECQSQRLVKELSVPAVNTRGTQSAGSCQPGGF